MECRIADASLSIRLNPEIADRLAAVVIEGFKAVPRRGLEVGGLLLGKIEGDCVFVDDFSPVDSEHLHGPSWLLSDKDKTFLAQEISRVAADERGLRVVGLYRSHTRPDFAATAEDHALIKAHSPDGRSVFLLLKPQASGPLTAAWFAAGAGLWDRPVDFAVPLHTPSAPQRCPDPPLHPQPPLEMIRHRTARMLEAASAYEPEILPPPPKPPRRPAWIGWLTPAAILLSSAIGGYLIAAILVSKPAPTPPAVRPLLNITLEQGSLHLRWDRDAAAVRKAAGAIVWIEDGTTQRRLDLKTSDLAEGSIQYWPSSNDVNFRLELLHVAGGSESVRATGMPVRNAAEHRTAPLARVNFEALKPRRAAPNFAAARPLRPVVPPDPASARQGEVLIKVQVEIDRGGKVIRADLVSRPSADKREFENVALRSARLWIFTPARSGERRVGGRGILYYTFGNAMLAEARGPVSGNNSLQKP